MYRIAVYERLRRGIDKTVRTVSNFYLSNMLYLSLQCMHVRRASECGAKYKFSFIPYYFSITSRLLNCNREGLLLYNQTN